jgi:phenylpropionate dioxygenase-like ring-hydroxylating dioxygenase large terminal subunit
MATTLIPDAYRSAEFYELEQERIFAKSWVCVGYTSQVQEPGAIFRVTIAGQPLFITRDKAGQLHAFYNVCRHRGSQLLTADGQHEIIRCPYHSWGYGLDGKLLGAPYFKGLDVCDEERAVYAGQAKGFCKEDYGLLEAKIDTWGCFVFVNLDPHARPLTEWLGDLPERYARHPLADLQLVRRKQFQIQSNWKLIAENFMEYYHLPWVHPELCNISGFKNHYRYQGQGMYTGMCTAPLSIDPQTVRFDLPTLPRLNADEAQNAYWILLFPNIAIFLLPQHVFTLLYQPDGPGKTLEFGDMLVHPNALNAPASIDAIHSFWAMVNEQDIAAVEGVQNGLQAKAYPGGRMCYRFEEPIHRFQNMVIDMMTGQHRIPPGDDQPEPLRATTIPAE